MLRTFLDVLGEKPQVIECSIKDFDFLDERPLDLSMEPGKVINATGLKFKTVGSSCEEVAQKMEGIGKSQNRS